MIAFSAATRRLVQCALRALMFVLLAAFAWPVSDAQAQNGYRLRTGDTLRVEVFEDSSLNRDIVVLPDGSIRFPFAGTIPARGRTVGQVEAAITEGIAPNFAARPTVFVSVPATAPVPEAAPPAEVPPATIDIYFIGEVASPGLQQLSPGTTLLQALAQGGGFTTFAAQKRVQLRRTDPHTGRPRLYTLNYRALANGAGLSRDVVLRDGDVILVPERRLFE